MSFFKTARPTTKKAAKGKLLDCFNNRRRDYKKSGVITSHSRQAASPIEQHSLNLNTINSVEKYWSIIRNYRLKHLFSIETQTVCQYMNEFPVLKKPMGYNLVQTAHLFHLRRY
ncbi:uncharacterized protein LOC112681255 [Sipha flava]|uniref:Uncharacterized protein LOC112681255 n=1 Tax=Sipha flava TaxID=143950 RepID=A0A8B8FA84_9HEMI|nr:uncharacterized protein LOC112681255 [Sipha flava]